MIVTILVAGHHSRLQEIIGETPKFLYPLTPRGDNFLSLMITGMKSWDVTDYLLIVGKYFESLLRYCSTHEPGRLKVVRANPDYVKGPLFTFLTALPAFAEKFTIIYPADLFMAPQGYRVLKDVIGKGSTRLFTQTLQPFHHGPVVINGKILAQKDVVIGKDAQALLPIAQVTPDFVVFAQDLSRRGISKVLDVLRMWQEAGNKLEFISLPPFFWIDVDTPEDLVRIQQYLKTKPPTVP